MKLDKFTKNLINRDGIWFSKNQPKISYPEEGNDLCYQLEDTSYWFGHRNKNISSLVKRFNKDDIFFDIGGGNGFVALGLQKDGIDSVLLEPGISGVKHAKDRGLNNLICTTLEEANFEENTINSAGAFDVIEHIENDVEFLKILNKYMKVGGNVYITVPALKFLWSDEDIYAGHFRRYTTKSLEDTLKKAGFEPVYSTYLFSILVLPILLLRTIPSLFKRRKGGEENNFKNEHKETTGILGKIFNKSFNWEINRVANLKKIPFGSSCLIVAKKI